MKSPFAGVRRIALAIGDMTDMPFHFLFMAIVVSWTTTLLGAELIGSVFGLQTYVLGWAMAVAAALALVCAAVGVERRFAEGLMVSAVGGITIVVVMGPARAPNGMESWLLLVGLVVVLTALKVFAIALTPSKEAN